MKEIKTGRTDWKYEYAMRKKMRFLGVVGPQEVISRLKLKKFMQNAFKLPGEEEKLETKR